MENSIISDQVSSSQTRTTGQSSGESSWTSYLEDFLLNETKLSSKSSSDDQTDHVLASGSSSSLITDKEQVMERLSMKKSCSRSSFKRRKKREKLVDEALEDTAISPISTPKEKVESPDHDGDDNHCTESPLKKKGLCLVPLSMVVNYFG